ncbi:LysR family transcriptional regulator [Agromyces sp. SYSU K20354]|uniref:LysR substrate-binding domain-containing protein n=1 Tax=Agromyces cavernae TaxID=2898659 RepID=UPI001E2DB6A5|nr:LysR family transcriptional regulator [Agromyces cavernae]MCD2440880.1 LysR family transcriptional regulator [Agromyces cavernae]
MDLRDIEIFLTLAEVLHFGRTAERLHVSQARVSQAIRNQERQLGGLLFERTSRHVRLTALGAQLRDDLSAGYEAILDGLAKARESASGVVGTLRLGVMGNDGSVFIALIENFRRRHTGCEIEIREIHFSDVFGELRRGEVDAVVAWRPVREPDLTEGPSVFTVGRVLALWEGHPLGERESISLEDLPEHVHVDPGDLPEHWIGAMLPARTPSGRKIPRVGPRPKTFHEVLTLVSARQCVTPAGAQAAFYGGFPGVVFVPIHDAPPLHWALIWRTANETPLVRAFAEVCRDAGPVGLAADGVLAE